MGTMPLILPCGGKTPRIHSSAYIAPNATIIGDVEIGPDSSIFYGCVLRADSNSIRIGARSNIQDNSVLHVDADAPVVIGDDVTVGHMALVHGSTVADGVLVGMKSALLSRSTIGRGSLIAAGAVVLEGMDIPPLSLAAGVPAKIRRTLSEEEARGFIEHAGRYIITAHTQPLITEAVDIADVRYD
ncbi:gamma carbonic anhydrase family protein [Corynebacterium sp. ES2794-CONJ1]|uniref:gamma carbonic anhydrase family protein n=1 Tax=unclassified Corynebacterium TaxID=2624378 RepID=UPI00216731C8|nr:MULTISPECIES: gamma carbonic anhydrase family protein [unclassified Corynebacterium]MCS4490402.1 gamma carbonic anhydrase family protein [Corynebacterium sp. ES2775-CONJ]MCU9519701.1 gamma carbonic anhydrase family protein [Corynebacterium sp. ES2794-CONJ1]